MLCEACARSLTHRRSGGGGGYGRVPQPNAPGGSSSNSTGVSHSNGVDGDNTTSVPGYVGQRAPDSPAGLDLDHVMRLRVLNNVCAVQSMQIVV
jgi:hypothetical protein